MSRRMISPEQLNRAIDKKLDGYDAAIPTTINGGGDYLWIEHDGNQLGDKVHLKQLFGKSSLVGNGNITLFMHYITLMNIGSGASVVLNVLSASNLIVDSAQDLNRILGSNSKPILSSIGVIEWEGSFAATTSINSYTKMIDTVEAL